MKSFSVPANSSRYFESEAEAIKQPQGIINFVPHPEGYFYNSSFNSSLVKYDDTYQTENRFHLQKSIGEFNKLASQLSGYRFVEIGCGQGEFIDYLISIGESATGYDPVCRVKSAHLNPEFFDIGKIPSSAKKIVFVMRCVLPHIEEPFGFIDEILERFPSSLILMQHQRIEHFLKFKAWNALMHDHVNIFQESDFDKKYNVLSKSKFAKNEWQQILIARKSKTTTPSSKKSDLLEPLLQSRISHLEALMKLEEIYLFGAAGKGINFAYACIQNRIRISGAIDDQPNIWYKYMDSSGVQVLPPKEIKKSTLKPSLIVMNHNYLESARKRFSDTFEVHSLMTL